MFELLLSIQIGYNKLQTRIINWFSSTWMSSKKLLEMNIIILSLPGAPFYHCFLDQGQSLSEPEYKWINTESGRFWGKKLWNGANGSDTYKDPVMRPYGLNLFRSTLKTFYFGGINIFFVVYNYFLAGWIFIFWWFSTKIIKLFSLWSKAFLLWPQNFSPWVKFFFS